MTSNKIELAGPLRKNYITAWRNSAGRYDVEITVNDPPGALRSRFIGGPGPTKLNCHSMVLNQYQFFRDQYFADGATSSSSPLSIVLNNFSTQTVRTLLEYIYTQDLSDLNINIQNFEEVLRLAEYFTIPRSEISLLGLTKLQKVKSNSELMKAMVNVMKSPEFADDFRNLSYTEMRRIIDPMERDSEKKQLFLVWTFGSDFEVRKKMYDEDYRRLFTDYETTENGRPSNRRAATIKTPRGTPTPTSGKRVAKSSCSTTPTPGTHYNTRGTPVRMAAATSFTEHSDTEEESEPEEEPVKPQKRAKSLISISSPKKTKVNSNTKVLSSGVNWLLYTATDGKKLYLEAFNPESSEKQRLHVFTRPKEYAGMAHVNETIYCIGGNTNVKFSTYYATKHLNGSYASTNEVDLFTPDKFEGVPDPNLNIRRFEKYPLISEKGINVCSTAVHENNIYVIGGNHTVGGKKAGEISGVTTGVVRIDTTTGTWENCPDLKQARGWHSSIVMDNFIYVMGGYEDKVMKSVERWDVNNKRGWELLEKDCWMKDYRTCCGTFSYDGKIYCAGGCGQWGTNETFLDKLQNTVEVFDTKIEKSPWKLLSPMNRRREDFGVCTTNDYVYVIGGEKSKEGALLPITMEKYDPRKDKWTLVLNVSFPSKMFFYSSITIPWEYVRKVTNREDESE